MTRSYSSTEHHGIAVVKEGLLKLSHLCCIHLGHICAKPLSAIMNLLDTDLNIMLLLALGKGVQHAAECAAHWRGQSASYCSA